MNLRRYAAAALLTAAATGSLATAAVAGAATTSDIHFSSVRSVCAQDLYVRAKPAGVTIGTLYQGDNFDVSRYSPSGDWAYGHAYGSVHQDGWVQETGLC